MPNSNWLLPDERAGAAAPESLLLTRARIAAAPPIYPPYPGVRAERTERNGVICLELTPAKADRTFLYLHGGGYRMGSCDAYEGFAGLIAARASARVIIPEYRLAPEHPFPAALTDAVRVLASLVDLAEPLIIGGDSAGGGLASAATIAAGLTGLARPDAVVLLSPWLDLTLSGETFVSRNECDRLFPQASAAEAAGLYLQGYSPTDPLVSPLFADVTGFPPTLLLAGLDETLLSDSTRFAERLALAGTSVTALFPAGMQHIWPIISPELPETADAISAIIAFVGRARR